MVGLRSLFLLLNKDRLIVLSRRNLLSFAIAVISCGACWGADEIDFSNRSSFAETPSADGAVTLTWETADDREVEVQQATVVDFSDAVQRYRGADPGTVLTGLPEGRHYFRIRDTGVSAGQWSAPLQVTVEFFPRQRLFLFLGLGGVVVLAPMGSIVGGFFQVRRRDHDTGEGSA